MNVCIHVRGCRGQRGHQISSSVIPGEPLIAILTLDKPATISTVWLWTTEGCSIKHATWLLLNISRYLWPFPNPPTPQDLWRGEGGGSESIPSLYTSAAFAKTATIETMPREGAMTPGTLSLTDFQINPPLTPQCSHCCWGLGVTREPKEWRCTVKYGGVYRIWRRGPGDWSWENQMEQGPQVARDQA